MSWVEVKMSWVVVDGAGWSWLKVDGTEWRWVGARFSNTRILTILVVFIQPSCSSL